MKYFVMVLGAILTAVGVYCVFVPEVTIITSGILTGILLLLCGVSSLIAYFQNRKYKEVSVAEILVSVVTVMLGLILIYNRYAGVLTERVLSYCIAGVAFFYGAPKIYIAYRKKKEYEKGSYVDIIIGVAFILVGLFVIINPIIIGIALGWLMGVFFAGMGLNLVILGITMKKDIEDDVIEAEVIEINDNEKIENKKQKRIK